MSSRSKRIALLLLPPLAVEAIRRIRRLARGLGEPARMFGTAIIGSGQRYWGLHKLDRQVEKYLDFEGGYYVELGANDGIFSSNTLYYERCRGWSGVLIEPAPNRYLECRKNRSAQNHVACAACVSFDYKGEFVKIVYSDSMSVSLNVETDIGDGQAHAELGRQFLRPSETIFTFGALARTLQSILIEAGAPRQVDFLSLDVEGSEIEVLRGIDHDCFKFRYMLIECRDLDKLTNYLDPLGYHLVDRFNECDYLFSCRASIKPGAVG